MNLTSKVIFELLKAIKKLEPGGGGRRICEFEAGQTDSLQKQYREAVRAMGNRKRKKDKIILSSESAI